MVQLEIVLGAVFVHAEPLEPWGKLPVPDSGFHRLLNMASGNENALVDYSHKQGLWKKAVHLSRLALWGPAYFFDGEANVVQGIQYTVVP